MKKSLLWLPFLLVIAGAACKNGDKKKEGSSSGASLKARADSLYDDLLKEHEKGMSGWMKIEGRQKQIRNILDSIGSLPATAQATLEAYTASLTEASGELGTAYEKMDTWMRAMNLDSAADNAELRIQYLTGEKIRGSEVTALINNSLQKADSLLQHSPK